MSKKKFCIVTTIPSSLNFFKGQLNYISNTFDVVAISSEKEKLIEFGKRENVAVHYIPMKRNISLLDDCKSLFQFISYFKSERPDIVHGNTPKGAFLSMLAAKLTGVPTRIYMCHGLRYQGSQGGMKVLLKLMEKLACWCATEILCVSTGVKKVLIIDGICQEHKLKVILNGSANGIDTSYYNREKVSDLNTWKTKLGISDNDFVYCFVGRIVKDKGINELVSAFDRLQQDLKHIHLIVVGQQEKNLDPISKETEEKIKNNAHIHMVGLQSDVRPFMGFSNVFVLPSYREGFGQVLVEACSLGVPCITTDITGCNEIIQDGINGKIIPPRNENALYKMMKWFYDYRDDEVKIMASNARPMIAERYDRHKVWNALLNEYQTLLKM